MATISCSSADLILQKRYRRWAKSKPALQVASTSRPRDVLQLRSREWVNSYYHAWMNTRSFHLEVIWQIWQDSPSLPIMNLTIYT